MGIRSSLVVKRVRAKFSKNCAFCDTSMMLVSQVRFHFGIRTNIIYATISEIHVVVQKFRISYILLLNSITVKKYEISSLLTSKIEYIIRKLIINNEV